MVSTVVFGVYVSKMHESEGGSSTSGLAALVEEASSDMRVQSLTHGLHAVPL